MRNNPTTLTFDENCQAFVTGGLVAFVVITIAAIITAAIVFIFGDES